MIIIRSYLTKYISIQILVTLLFALQITACSNEDFAEKITDDISTENSNSSTRTDVNLSWSAPSARDNNEPISLSEIAGYKVYYGTEKRKYPKNINIKDGSATDYTLKNLAAGTYHIALTTYDTAGRESQYSTEIVIVV
ncbi:MAG: hypothetical protein GQ572_00390 [Gammaproteobacteria bacterium]|nr:hypothetical protein [Gammaproteobacteria bacterium]